MRPRRLRDPFPPLLLTLALLTPTLLAGCRDGRDEPALPHPATRVLSLVPSVTEIVVRLGAAEVLVGRTDYDTLAVLRDLPSTGGGLGPDLEVVRALEPQVVIAFAGESDPRTGPALEGLGIPVLAVRPDRLADVPRIIREVGALVGRDARAAELVAELEAELEAVRAAVAERPRVRAVYLLGGSPPLAAGPGSFISDLLTVAGATNALDDLPGLYAPVGTEVLLTREIDVILTTRGSRIDPRVRSGRRTVEMPAWVEIPGPALGRAAWTVARALHPGLDGGG
ncbi:MAG: helical backbone metal receptor [Longimicrobiales bacterium]|nr:helical backbone metal receptor [Longimicrobiales bacterium]